MFPLNKMLKQNANFKWTYFVKQAFINIKEALNSAPTVVQSNFGEPFKMYTYAFDHTVSSILTQVNDENEEYPITFMSHMLKITK